MLLGAKHVYIYGAYYGGIVAIVSVTIQCWFLIFKEE